MPRKGHGRGVVLWAAAAVAATAALVVAGMASMSSMTAHWKPAFVVESSDLVATLVRCGLDPQRLAASGVNASGATALVARARDHLTQSGTAMGNADQSRRSSHSQLGSLEMLAMTGQATPEQLQSLGTLRSNAAGAGESWDSALAAFKTAATAGLTEPQRAALATLWANRSWDVPAAYLLVDRSDADWIALDKALSNVRIAQACGEDPDPAASALVASAAAQNATATANQQLNANLDLVKSAWIAAVESP